MRTICFVFAVIGTISFVTPVLPAHLPNQEKSAGKRGPGQQAGGPGGRFGAGGIQHGQGKGGFGGMKKGGMQKGGMQKGGMKKGGGQNGGGPGGGMSSRMMQMMPLYIALDKDKDGQLSKAEIRDAVKAIKTLDKNGNGVIDVDEMAPDRSQMRGGQGGPGGRQGMGQGRGRGGMQGGGAMRGGKGGGKAEGGATRPKRPGKDDA